MVVAFAGCAGWSLTDTPTTNATAYLSGKAMGIAITEIVPEAGADLEGKWSDMMARNKALELMPVAEILRFYSECIGILGIHTEDPYGLIMDLGILLMIFGAEFNVNGDMIAIEPVPMVVLTYFGLGYDSGKMVVLR
jgi:hypothetical protein